MTDVIFCRPNISLSATSNNISPITESSSSVPYIPPHPQSGTPYHRYVLLLLPQKKTLDLIGSEITRLGFDIRSFALQHYLQIAHDDGRSDAGGIFMWRGIWDSSVSDIYKNILSQSPVVFFSLLPAQLYPRMPRTKVWSSAEVRPLCRRGWPKSEEIFQDATPYQCIPLAANPEPWRPH